MPDTIDIENVEQLIAYLREQGHIWPDETPVVQPLAGGVSNRTVLVRRPTGEAWVLKQALEKLRTPVDWFSSPERVHREALGLRALQQLAPNGAVPNFVFEDHAQHILAMEAVPEPHENWKQMLLAGQLQEQHVRQFGRLLASVHRGAWERRAEFAGQFADRSFFDSLRLEPYYQFSGQQVPQAAAFLEALVSETRAHTITLVHGDYSPKNILVHSGRLVLLDHEVIHWGDPGFDLGFSTTHFLSKAHHLPAHRHDFADAAVYYWQVYFGDVGDLPWTEGLEARAVRHTLACLLARVAGRSPLEYMSEQEKARQRQAVLACVARPPTTIEGLAEAFLQALSELAG